MMMQFDILVAQERYNDMLREAQRARLAQEVAAGMGGETLLERMAKLFAGPLRRRMHQPQQNKSVAPQTLADARSR